MRSRALLCLAILVATQRAHSADGWGGSLALTSDYILRGISQSDGAAAVQGDIHYQSSSGWSAGVWTSTVKLSPNDATSAEVNYFAGFSWPLDSDWSAKIQAVHYAYPWHRPIDGYDYDEVLASLNFRDRLYLTLSYSPNSARFSYYGFAENLTAYSADVQWQQPLYRALSGSVGVGVYHLHDPVNTQYWFWNLGLGYSFESLHLDVSFIGASDSAKTLFYSDAAYGTAAGPHWTATLLWRF